MRDGRIAHLNNVNRFHSQQPFLRCSSRQLLLVLALGLYLFPLVITLAEKSVSLHGHEDSELQEKDEEATNNDEEDEEYDEDNNVTNSEEQSVPTNAKTALYYNRVDELRSLLDEGLGTDHIGFESLDPQIASQLAVTAISDSVNQRLARMFQKAKSNECRSKIAKHMGYFVHAIGIEQSLPFTDVKFPNECGEPVYDFTKMPEGMHIGHVQNRTYQPLRNESVVYLDDPNDLVLCYGILSHDNPGATIRLIESLDESGLNHSHQFVVHVDGKEVYKATQDTLLYYARTHKNVHILPDNRRVRVNWGGFSMVNATLQILQYIFETNIMFHKFVHISSSTYPIASNTEIRHKLASYPLDANFLHVIMQPTRASNYVWNYFVECDDAIHRIYQLPVLYDSVHGANTFTGSQWFIASYEFAEYLASAPDGSFVDQYLRYVEHVVVADESFFSTVIRHTKFCHKHHNRNFLHLQFDRWESELPARKRDERKCPMPNPDHCGRSPTIMTLDYADIMELSDNLFARKFDEAIDKDVKDVVDKWRTSREESIAKNETDPLNANQMKNFHFEGHGVLIVARETVQDAVPLCMGLGSTGNKILLVPCFEDWVPPTLARGWETGAVILSETIPHTRWEVGPCTTDGELQRLSNGRVNVTLGQYSKTGPRCMLKQMDGIRTGRCFDCGPEKFQPGGKVQVYPCTREWYQFVSFGDGKVTPTGSLYATIPSHIVTQIRNLGHEQIPYMCLGVQGRGDNDELPWEDKTDNDRKIQKNDNSNSSSTSLPLSKWNEEPLWSTQCSNRGAVIDWAFVPFITSEDEIEVIDDEATKLSPVDLSSGDEL